MLKRIALLLMLCLPLSAGDPWSKTDIAMEAAFQALVFTDWRQTTYLPTQMPMGLNIR
jgi:ABC-type uncharacterized transport system YnjBCD ATPase subunit